ncbi:unnamed protein product, partial [Ectocarpus sp. 8 AP-2014]
MLKSRHSRCHPSRYQPCLCSNRHHGCYHHVVDHRFSNDRIDPPNRYGGENVTIGPHRSGWCHKCGCGWCRLRCRRSSRRCCRCSHLLGLSSHSPRFHSGRINTTGLRGLRRWSRRRCRHPSRQREPCRQNNL